MLTESEMQAVCGPLTAELHLEKGSMLVCEGIPIVEVEFACTLVSNEDAERESSLWSLVRALNDGRDGQN